jgi:ketosteroid isomerase-like protein
VRPATESVWSGCLGAGESSASGWIGLCVGGQRLPEVNVIARVFLAALLMLSTPPLVARTTSASPPIDAAERAFVSALMLPDRDAFRLLLADDAVFFLPVESRGPEAIVQSWRPFLSSPEVRLAPIIERSSTADSGAMAETFGTFSVYGRTSKGMTTTPAGSFSIEWRLDDGRWKIAALKRT